MNIKSNALTFISTKADITKSPLMSSRDWEASEEYHHRSFIFLITPPMPYVQVYSSWNDE